ncbi:hypothetical protein SDB73_15430 [Legionella pneumophila serogroup 1]
METWTNLQKGFTANECFSSTYTDADVWLVCLSIARLYRQTLAQIKKAVPLHNFGRAMGRT